MTGIAVLVAGIWAGAAWGTNGRVPLVISGCIGAAIAAALLIWETSPEGT